MVEGKLADNIKDGTKGNNGSDRLQSVGPLQSSRGTKLLREYIQDTCSRQAIHAINGKAATEAPGSLMHLGGTASSRLESSICCSATSMRHSHLCGIVEARKLFVCLSACQQEQQEQQQWPPPRH